MKSRLFNKNSRKLFSALCPLHDCEDGKPSNEYLENKLLDAYQGLLSIMPETVNQINALEQGAKACSKEFSVKENNFITKTLNILEPHYDEKSRITTLLPKGYLAIDSSSGSALLSIADFVCSENDKQYLQDFWSAFTQARQEDITQEYLSDVRINLANTLLPLHAAASSENAFEQMLELISKYHPEIYGFLMHTFHSPKGLAKVIEHQASLALEKPIVKEQNLERVVQPSLKALSLVIPALMAMTAGASAISLHSVGTQAEDHTIPIPYSNPISKNSVVLEASDALYDIADGTYGVIENKSQPGGMDLAHFKLDDLGAEYEMTLSLRSPYSGGTISVNFVDAVGGATGYHATVYVSDTDKSIYYWKGTSLIGSSTDVAVSGSNITAKLDKSETFLNYVAANSQSSAGTDVFDVSNTPNFVQSILDYTNDSKVEKSGSPPSLSNPNGTDITSLTSAGGTVSITTNGQVVTGKEGSNHKWSYEILMGDARMQVGQTDKFDCPKGTIKYSDGSETNGTAFLSGTMLMFSKLAMSKINPDPYYGDAIRIYANQSLEINASNWIKLSDSLRTGANSGLYKQPPPQIKHQPTFAISADETLKPVTPEKIASPNAGDDRDVTNNLVNFYDLSKKALFSAPDGKPILFSQKVSTQDYNYEIIFFYWTDNPSDIPLLSHAHDWEYIIYKCDKSNNLVDIALSNHLDMRKTTDSNAVVYVGQGGHEMTTNKNELWNPFPNLPRHFEDGGPVYGPGGYYVVSLNSIIDSNSIDNFERYKTDSGHWAFGGPNEIYFSILPPDQQAVAKERAKVPWLQAVLQDPESAFRQTGTKPIITAVDLKGDDNDLELRVTDGSSVTGKKDGSVKAEIPAASYAKINSGESIMGLYASQSTNSNYQFEIHALKDTSYTIKIYTDNNGDVKINEYTDSIKAGETKIIGANPQPPASQQTDNNLAGPLVGVVAGILIFLGVGKYLYDRQKKTK